MITTTTSVVARRIIASCCLLLVASSAVVSAKSQHHPRRHPSFGLDGKDALLAVDPFDGMDGGHAAVVLRGGATTAASKNKKKKSSGNIFDDMSLSQKFLSLSCATATVGGALTVLDWDTAVKYMFPGLKDVAISDPLKYTLSAALFGWAIGKYGAVMAGPAATKEYCKLNAFVFIPILLYAQAGGEWDLPLWAIFEALYVYFGYVE